MLNSNLIPSSQYEQVLQTFSTYLNDMNLVINTLKKSIYQILNIQLHPSQALTQPSIASVSANGKKTLDDMKRISSILRGYSRSKNVQRQEDQTRRSRIQNSSLSRQSRVSRYSNNSSDGHFSRVERAQSVVAKKQQIMMVTFQVPQSKAQYTQQQNGTTAFISRLRNYQSMRSLSKTTQLPSNGQKMTESYQTAQFNYTDGIQNSPIYQQKQSTSMSRKRARTLQKSCSTQSISRIITETQTKFNECLEKHDFRMTEIIKRNSQCLDILKDIHKNLKNKKNKKTRYAAPSKDIINGVNGARKPVAKYQAMTPSHQKEVSVQN